MSDRPVAEAPGIGPVTGRWLEDAGIRSLGDLQALGSVEAWRRLKFMLPKRVSLNALYALEGALRGVPGPALPAEVREDLKRQAAEVRVEAGSTSLLSGEGQGWGSERQ